MVKRAIQSISALALISLSLTGCEQAAQQVEEAQDGFEEGFNTTWRTSYVDECVSAATQSGAETAMANDYCTCTADYLIETIPASERMSEPNNTQLNDAIEHCVGTRPLEE